ncbi:MAG: penicillin-binding protein 2 [Dehalococcoidia bacterium]|nr:penicillin-binding protein 2 [Dehalococcoidia bacterium]
MNPPPLDRRVRVLQVAAFALFALLALQLVRMQLFRSGHYQQLADELSTRAVPIEAARGIITDRNGVVLARNQPEFQVVVIPGELPAGPASRLATLAAVERATGVPLATLDDAVRAGEHPDAFAPVVIRDRLDTNAAIEARAALTGLDGVRVDAHPVRVYASGDLMPQILGYVGAIEPDEVSHYLNAGYALNDRVGRSGVELTYESFLRGQPGKHLISSHPSGREVARLADVAPQTGSDLVLSIDLRLQQAVRDALQDGIAKALPPGGRDASGQPALAAGAAVVMDVHTGELLALVSLPSYDANVFAGRTNSSALEALLNDPARPLLHRGYMEVHAPGSIFKPLVGAAALQEGIATPATRITSTGAITIQDIYNPGVRYVFRDWAAHGTLDFYGGIARSSDVYFYYLAGGYNQGDVHFEGLGADRVATYARGFGLGAATGLDLPGEAGGLVPDTKWKEDTIEEPWVLGDTYTFGIGQGYLTATPVQMAVAAAAIANGGDVLQPHVAHGLRRGGAVDVLPRAVRGHVPVDATNLEVVREAMRVAASPGGTAFEGKPDNVVIGGKTGTAEFGAQRPDGSYDSHGWYMGFAPYDNPQVAVIVYIEHGIGQTYAAPVAKRILEAYFALPPGQALVSR